MVTRNSQGQVIRVFAYSSPMRKHGGDAQQHQDKTLAALDAVSKLPVKYDAPVRIRKGK